MSMALHLNFKIESLVLKSIPPQKEKQICLNAYFIKFGIHFLLHLPHVLWMGSKTEECEGQGSCHSLISSQQKQECIGCYLLLCET